MEEKSVDNQENKDKKIEIIQGNPKDLDISDVKDNLTFEVRKDNNKQNIIIPENQRKSEEEKD